MDTEKLNHDMLPDFNNDHEAGINIDLVKFLMQGPSMAPAISSTYKKQFAKKSEAMDIYMQSLTNIYNPPPEDTAISRKTVNNIKNFTAKETPKMTKSLRTREKVYQVTLGGKPKTTVRNEVRGQNSKQSVKKLNNSTTTTVYTEISN